MKVTVTAAPLPTNFRGTPQELIEAFLDRLEISVDGSSFVVGDVMPIGNQGPWLRNGTQWWVWDVNTSTYIPLDVSSSVHPQIFIGDVAAGAPDSTKYQLWLQLNGSVVNGLYYFAGNTLGWITELSVLVNGSISSAMLQAGSVTTVALANGSVTVAKLQNGIPLSVFAAGNPYQFVRTFANGEVGWGRLMNASPLFSIAAGAGFYSWSHGLGGIPNLVRVVFVCITDSPATGYAAGDEIEATFGSGSTSSGPGSAEESGANILCNDLYVKVLGLTNQVKTAANSARVTITGPEAVNWNVKIYAGIA
jgi:hypothetical protein